MPDPAPAPKSIAEVANEGGLLPAAPEDQDVSQLPASGGGSFAIGSPGNARVNAGVLASKFPTTVKAFVGNRAIELPPDQAQKALDAGTIKVPANQDLHVRLADGSFKVIPADQFNQHRADGATLVSAHDHHLADLGEKYDTGVGSGLLATALGGVRGLSTVPGGGSISDELVDLVGGAEGVEAANYLKEHRPTLSGIGEAGGMIGQALLLPGGGLAGLAEKGTAAVAGEGLAGRVLAQGARAAAENAQLTHTDLVSEEALGAPPITAEKYFATVGEQALWGGALGAGGAILGAGLGAAKRGIAEALTRETTAADIDGVAEKAFGYKPKGSVGEALVKAQALLSGADAEGKEAISNAGIQNWSKEARELRSAALHVDEVRTGAAKSLSDDMTALLQKTEAIADESRGISKRANMKGLVSSTLEAPELQAHAMDALQDVRNQISEMAADPETFGHGGALKRIDQQLRSHEKDLVSAVEKGDQAEMFAVLDDTKRTIGGWSRKFQAGAGDPLAREQAQEVFARLGDVERGGGIYEDLRKNLEDESTWGKAAAAQKGINAACTDFAAAQKQLGRAGVATAAGEGSFGRASYAVDPAKMEKYVGSLVNPTTDLAHKAMTDYIQSAKTLASAIDDSFELSADKQAMVTAVKASAIKMEMGASDIGDRLAKVNQIDALIKAGRGPGGNGAVFLGHLIGGPVGGAIGMAGSQLSNPGKNIMRLAQLESIVSKFDGKVGGAIGRFFERGEEGSSSKIAKAARTANTLRRGREEGERESIRTEFERRQKAIGALQDPAVVAQRMGAHFETLQGTAPQTASMLGATAAKAVAYLTSHMPTAEVVDPLTGEKGTPPLSEMATFNLRAEAVEHPESVMHDLARGRVTVEQVDAIKNVYPGIYRELQAKVQETIVSHAQAGRPLDFQQRVSLGVLLDVDTDPSLAKPAMGHAHATFSAPPAPAPKSSGGGRGGPSPQGRSLETPEQRMSSEPGAV